MELANVKEYDLVRSETEFVRDCITTYMGYAISGSGAALFGLAAMRVFGSDSYTLMVYVSLAVALLLSLVLAILLYKFNTHNRYVGYARIITDEIYKDVDSNRKFHDGQHTAWEICMEQMRLVQGHASQFRTLVNDTDIAWSSRGKPHEALDWMTRSYIEGVADKHRTRRGFAQLGLALTARFKTNSWAFPPHVVAIFCILAFMYIGIATYSLGLILVDFDFSKVAIAGKIRLYTVCAVYLIALIGLLLLWIGFCRRLTVLMTGSATIDAFSFRFMILRAAMLNQLGLRPSYPSFEQLMRNEAKNPLDTTDPVVIPL